MARGYTRPYPEDSEIPYQSLGAAREIEWEKDARKAVKAMARKFPGKDGDIRAGPPILWRVLHHPRRHNYAPVGHSLIHIDLPATDEAYTVQSSICFRFSSSENDIRFTDRINPAV